MPAGDANRSPPPGRRLALASDGTFLTDTVYEAIRFTFSASDSEDDVNQVGEKHAIDFDGDGQFEFNAVGNGEVFSSFPVEPGKKGVTASFSWGAS